MADRLPVVTMVYSNTILATGPERYAEMLTGAGGAGAIVPDLPPEEGGEIHAALTDAGLALIPLVAPTTPDDRRRRICAEAEGFVYVVSLAGVTGERRELPPELAGLVASVREEADVPAAVGFGIGTPEQAAQVGRIADGVIVGSRLVREAGEAGSSDAAARAVAAFLREARTEMSARSRA
jgi:tryptophan synthase alpha chain